ncbi:MAG: hypothetical protein Q8P20_04305 [bacterium]|nr:hypothetical protein [bacterium]
MKLNNKGAAALISVLIISAAALVIAFSSSLLGLGELDMGYTSQKSSEALSVADGCMEETFQRIKLNTTYGVGAGDINLTLGNGSCIIAVADLGSGGRTITISSNIGKFNKKIESDITITGSNITIDSWVEKND